AAVRPSDQLDDREPEPAAAAAARVVGAAEAVEGAGDEAGRKARPLVLDVQLDLCVAGLRREHDAPVSVGERVRNEVAERLLDADRVGIELEAVRRDDVEWASALAGDAREALGDDAEHLGR